MLLLVLVAAECINLVCRFDVMQNVYRYQDELDKKEEDEEEDKDGYFASPEQRKVSSKELLNQYFTYSIDCHRWRAC